MKRCTSSAKAKRVAVSAMLAACALVLLYLAGFLPSGRMGVAAAAGLFPAAAVTSCGFAAGFLCYAGSAVLGLLLVSDKNVALMYLLFFGLYPVIKGQIERIGRLWAELALKFLVFNGFAILLFLGFTELFAAMIPVGARSPAVLLLIANAVFFLYDYGFSKLMTFYRRRIDRALH